MALRVTRQNIELLVSGDTPEVWVTRQYIQVLCRANLFEPHIESTISLAQDFSYIGPKEVIANNVIIISQEALYPKTYEKTIQHDLSLTQTTAIVVEPGNYYITQFLDVNQFADYRLNNIGILERLAINLLTLNQTAASEYEKGRASENQIVLNQFLNIQRPWYLILEDNVNFVSESIGRNSVFRVISENTINFEQSLDIEYTQRIEANNSLTSYYTKYVDGELVIFEQGIEQQADAELIIINRKPNNTFTIEQIADCQHEYTTGFDCNARSIITINQELDRDYIVETDFEIIGTTDFEIFGVPICEIDIEQEIILELNGSGQVSNNISLNQTVTYEIISYTTLHSYSPFIGETTDSNAPTPPTAECRDLKYIDSVLLIYGADTLELRLPELSNHDRLDYTRINRETRGGTLIVYADPIWPKTQNMQLNFIGLSENEAQEILNFITLSLGKQILIRGWENHYWEGFITNPDTAIVRDGRNLFSISLELDIVFLPPIVSASSSFSILTTASGSLAAFKRSLTNNITFSQDINIEIWKSLTSSITLNQTAVSECIFERSLTNSITLNQTINIEVWKSLTSSITLSQTAVSETIFERSLTNSITLNQIAVSECIFERSLTSSITLNQTTVSECIFERSLTSSITLNQDTNIEVWKSLTSSITLSQVISIEVWKSLTSNITLNQTAVSETIFKRSLTSSITLNQTAVSECIFERSLTSSITLSQTAVSELIRTRYWVGATNSWNTDTNWAFTSGGAGNANIPDQYTDVHFDGSDVTDCTLDVAANMKTLTMAAGYTGHLNAATFAVTINGNTILSGTQVSAGSGKWTLYGDFNIFNLTTWNEDTAEISMEGTGKILTGQTGVWTDFNLLTINGNTTIGATPLRLKGLASVNAILTLSTNNQFRFDNGTYPNAELKINTNGEVTGNTGLLVFVSPQGNKGITVFNGALSVYETRIYYPQSTAYWAAGYYNSRVNVQTSLGAAAYVFKTLLNGIYRFKRLYLIGYNNVPGGTLTMDNTAGPISITIDEVLQAYNNTAAQTAIIITNNGVATNWSIGGHTSLYDVQNGSITWTKGIGKIIFENLYANINVNFNANTIEEIEVNETTYTITFSSQWTADYFWLKNGTVQFNNNILTTQAGGGFVIDAGANIIGSSLNGCTINVGGNFNVAGSVGDLLDLHAGATWNLNVTGTAVADYVDVDYSDASGGTAVTATNSNNGGNNISWNFS